MNDEEFYVAQVKRALGRGDDTVADELAREARAPTNGRSDAVAPMGKWRRAVRRFDDWTLYSFNAPRLDTSRRTWEVPQSPSSRGATRGGESGHLRNRNDVRRAGLPRPAGRHRPARRWR